LTQPQAKVLTVSDGVVAGTREDRSGFAVVELLTSHGFEVAQHLVCPDELEQIAATLRSLSAGFSGLVVTTGGTGFAPRDLTPEATVSVLERNAPGLAESMRAVSPLGRLSRGAAGTRGGCLILNVPGSPGGAVECLRSVIDVLPHALELLAGAHDPHPTSG
jgi:molybdopterin adenylyltransferase